MTVTAAAPGRASIIGNPSDMYGGAVLSCSVGMRAYATVTPGSRLVMETDDRIIAVDGPDKLVYRNDSFDIARAVINSMNFTELSCRISFKSEIPLKSGMAGSTALMAALIAALLAWQGKHPGPYELAELVRHTESDHLKVVCGFQDAYMSVFGGLNYMDFRGKYFSENKVSETYASVEPLAGFVKDLPFVLAHTGVRRISGSVHMPISERWRKGDADAAEGYRRITELAGLGKKALILKDWPLLGELMNENHAIQRKLGGSGESNERLIRASLKAGAAGAKLAGAGGGGTIIALWPYEDPAPLERALIDAGASAIYRPQVVPGTTVS